MQNKVLCRLLFVLIGFIFGLTLITSYLDKELLKDLQDSNEFKRELIYEYEIYHNAAENLINHTSTDSTAYFESKNKIDSLYKTQL